MGRKSKGTADSRLYEAEPEKATADNANVFYPTDVLIPMIAFFWWSTPSSILPNGPRNPSAVLWGNLSSFVESQRHPFGGTSASGIVILPPNRIFELLWMPLNHFVMQDL